MSQYRDISDVSYNLRNIGSQIDNLQQQRQDTIKYSASALSNLYKIYSRQQGFDEQRLLGREFQGSKIFEEDPAYTEAGFIEKMFTPAGGRVKLTETAEDYLNVEKTYQQGLKDNPYLLEGDDFFDSAPEVSRVDYRDNKKLVETINESSELFEEGAETLTEEVAEDGLGKYIPYVGLGLSAYDLYDSAKRGDKAGQAMAGIETGLYTASLFNPAFAIPASVVSLSKMFR